MDITAAWMSALGGVRFETYCFVRAFLDALWACPRHKQGPLFYWMILCPMQLAQERGRALLKFFSLLFLNLPSCEEGRSWESVYSSWLEGVY
jgi:hypothetical protein